MDLHENTEKNVVTATFEFPGVSKENTQIDAHRPQRQIRRFRRDETGGRIQENSYAVRERLSGDSKFSKTFRLSQGVKDEEIKACVNGKWSPRGHLPRDDA